MGAQPLFPQGQRRPPDGPGLGYFPPETTATDVASMGLLLGLASWLLM